MVNDRPSELNGLILGESRTLADFAEGRELQWLSPLRADEYRAFSSDFWRRLELPHPDPIAGFWPRQQPNWDAVAVVVGPHCTNGVLLLEAKSHTGEVESTCKASSPGNRDLIIPLARACKGLHRRRPIERLDYAVLPSGESLRLPLLPTSGSKCADMARIRLLHG